MIIAVGSKNQTKIDAVKDAVQMYSHLFPNAEVRGIDVAIEEFGHPKSLGETVKGAKSRAKKAFIKNCSFSFGIEGGLIRVPYTYQKYLETGACAIYDGNKYYIGLSPAIPWPTKVLEKILTNEADGSQAFHQLGFTKHKKLGALKGGILNVLTDGRMTREDFTRYSIISALIQLDKKEYF